MYRETKFSIGNRKYQVLTSTLGNGVAEHARKDFSMEDIRTLLKLKSKTTAINGEMQHVWRTSPSKRPSFSETSPTDVLS